MNKNLSIEAASTAKSGLHAKAFEADDQALLDSTASCKENV